ncbi:hypothetical protein [Lysobacter terrae]
MEFLYRITDQAPDLNALERAIANLDPAVVLDTDVSGNAIRISTSLTGHSLLACLRLAGVPATLQDIEQQPSVCCGGCGG